MLIKVTLPREDDAVLRVLLKRPLKDIISVRIYLRELVSGRVAQSAMVVKVKHGRSHWHVG